MARKKDLFSRRRFIAQSTATAGFAIVKPSAVCGSVADFRVKVDVDLAGLTA